MGNVTTIQVQKKVLRELQSLKESERQSYSELIQKLISVVKEARKPTQYDAFLHYAQSMKMKELWDNPKDAVWDDV